MGIKLEKIGADLEKARKKRAEWDAKVKDLEAAVPGRGKYRDP